MGALSGLANRCHKPLGHPSERTGDAEGTRTPVACMARRHPGYWTTAARLEPRPGVEPGPVGLGNQPETVPRGVDCMGPPGRIERPRTGSKPDALPLS